MTVVQEALELIGEVDSRLGPAERMMETVRENYTAYKSGERPDFQADFPINLEGCDAITGRPSGFHDLAHEMFLEMVGVVEAGQGYISTADGHKLFVDEIICEYGDQKIPIHVRYSSEILHPF
jgi:hypothetical protein